MKILVNTHNKLKYGYVKAKLHESPGKQKKNFFFYFVK